MKRNYGVSTIILSLCLSATTWAGYQHIQTAPDTGESDSSSGTEAKQATQQRNWQAALIRENGTREVIPNLGGYFQTMELKQKETCTVEITGLGLTAGRNVILFTTHGGLINGNVRTEIAVDPDDVLRFSYRNGTQGTHALHMLVNGRDTMMAFRVELEQTTGTTNE